MTMTMPILLSAALVAAPLTLLPPTNALQLTPTPPKYPPKSTSPTNNPPRPATRYWQYQSNGGAGGFGSSRQTNPSTTPLRAYTVADNKNNGNTWLNFLKLPNSFADLASQFGSAEDSLFSFEGGSASQIATRPYMPNLEIEENLTAVKGKDELLSELSALTATFDELQSSMDYKSQLYSDTIETYEYKVEKLEENNALLAEGLKSMTATLELKEQQIKELQQEVKSSAVTELEEENEMLRQRVRVLEVELSDIAFESRTQLVPADLPAANSNPAPTMSNAKASSDAAFVVTNTNNTKHTPKAPSGPVPSHILQQHQLEELKLQVEQYKQERSSVRKLFGLGFRRGISKVGKALNLWSPVHNLKLWGELMA